jgi:formyltetrahydrofolate synthetase
MTRAPAVADTAARLGLDPGELLPYGRDVAKVPLAVLERPRRQAGAGRLLLVSAMT